jgi:integrase
MKRLIGTELLRKLPPGPVDVRDTKLSGFVLRIRPSGTHSYFANYARGKWHLLGATDKLDPAEARAEAQKVLGGVWKGEDPQAAKRAKRAQITFATFVTKHYEPWATAQRKTGAEQTARLRSVFGDALDALMLGEITPFHVERWRSARLKAGISASTVNRDLNVLRAALRLAKQWKLLSAHPLADVRPSKVDRAGTVRYLSPAEEKRLRAALAARDDKRRAERERANVWRRERGYAEWAPHGTYTDHLTPIVLLALNTGMRRGELFAMRWADVDLVRAIVTVRGADAKSGQTRHVPLNTEVITVLNTWKDGSTTELAFAGRDGEPLDDIKTAWLKLAKVAKLENFRFHDLRHTFASKLVQAGVDLNTVRELLGHTDIKMTLRYAHLAPEHKAAAVAKLVGGA